MTLEEYTMFSLQRYKYNENKPVVSRSNDKELFDFLWEYPVYEQFFTIVE